MASQRLLFYNNGVIWASERVADFNFLIQAEERLEIAYHYNFEIGNENISNGVVE